jgi:ribonucleoside-diphosphate reductase alpha chain
MTDRKRLPNRRPAISTSFERAGARFKMTAGYYPDGRLGEIFLAADRANSLQITT